MGRQADDSGIDKQIIELVKLRVSQFNNFAFCLQIHLNVARKLGVPQEKLDLVATWEEAGIFPEQERAGAYLGGDADAPRRPQRLERSLPKRCADTSARRKSPSSRSRSPRSMPRTGWEPRSALPHRFRGRR